MTNIIFKTGIYFFLSYLLCIFVLYFLPEVQWVSLVFAGAAIAYMGYLLYSTIKNEGVRRSASPEVSTELISSTIVLITIATTFATFLQWSEMLPTKLRVWLDEFFMIVCFGDPGTAFMSLAFQSSALTLGAHIFFIGGIATIVVCVICTIAMWVCHMKGLELAGYSAMPNEETYSSAYTPPSSAYTPPSSASQMPTSEMSTIYEWKGQCPFDWDAVARWNASMRPAPDTLPLRGFCSDGISLVSRDVPLSQLDSLGHYDIGSGESCQWRIPDSTIASTHASLRLKGGMIYLKAISERTVTKVANQQVAAQQAVPLTQTATITLGGVQLRVF